MNLLSYMQYLIDCPTITNLKDIVEDILKSKFSDSDKLEMISSIVQNRGKFGLCNDETFMEAFNARY